MSVHLIRPEWVEILAPQLEDARVPVAELQTLAKCEDAERCARRLGRLDSWAAVQQFLDAKCKERTGGV